MLKNRTILSEQDWQEIIAEYEARAMSCKEFCKLHNLSKGQVYKWRKYFLSQKNTKIKLDEAAEFIPMKINRAIELAAIASTIKSPIKLSGASGITLELLSGCAISELKAIMELLHAAK